MVVGEQMVAMPVKDIGPHIQVVAWQVRRGVLDGVELVPKHPLDAGWRRGDGCLQRHVDRGGLRHLHTPTL